jgi:glycosyltransferase involved in cell wall biosynthesis
MRTLYLCYFGLREPLVQSQVLPYLKQLAAAGIQVNLLTFEAGLRENWNEAALAEQRSKLAASGIRWFFLPYHKRPSVPATLYDVVAGARFAARMVRREGVEVLHARSHIPAAMALMASRWSKCKLIFDIRGLMAEEYSDAGVWRENSPPFRAVKMIERAGIRRADQLVVLTKRMRDWLVKGGRKAAEQIEVIPCCVDVLRFGDHSREDSTKDASPISAGRFEVVYAGSITGLYLLEEMGRFFMALRERRPEAFLRILTVSSAADGAAVLRRTGLSDEDFWIGAVAPREVPRYLARARLGISFRKPTFSQIAASPTKIPEYLAAGLPVICNAGVGDTDELIEKERIGVCLESFDAESYRAAAEKALALADDPETRSRCRRVVERYFDLHSVGGAGYLKVYRRLDERGAFIETGTETFG